MKKSGVFFGIGAVTVIVLFVGLFSLTSGPSRRDVQVAQAQAQAVEAVSKVMEIDAHYDGKTILDVVKTHNDIAEADAYALRQLATYQMRRNEQWRGFGMACIVLAFCIVLASILYAVGQSPDRLYVKRGS